MANTAFSLSVEIKLVQRIRGLATILAGSVFDKKYLQMYYTLCPSFSFKTLALYIR